MSVFLGLGPTTICDFSWFMLFLWEGLWWECSFLSWFLLILGEGLVWKCNIFLKNKIKSGFMLVLGWGYDENVNFLKEKKCFMLVLGEGLGWKC